MELLNNNFSVFEDPIFDDQKATLNLLSETKNLLDSNNKTAAGLCQYCANYVHCTWIMTKKIFCEHYE